MLSGGSVVNGSAKNLYALINQGIYIAKQAGMVTNFGTITASKAGHGARAAYIYGVYLGGGGTVTNGTDAVQSSYIGGAGVRITGGYGKVKNSGTIEAGNNDGVGVYMSYGLVTNGSTIDTTALISGEGIGLATGQTATLTNFGTISGGDLGVQWSGGALTNGSSADTAAQIVGAYGVTVTGGDANLKNFGRITGKSGAGVYIGKLSSRASATLTNGSSADSTALIKGGAYGVLVNSGAATVINYGTIIGSNGIAVELTSASDRLNLEGGSSFVGAVVGGGGTLNLTAGSGTVSGLGTSFSGFGYYLVSGGASWTLSGANSLQAGTYLLNRGTLVIAGSLGEGGSLTNIGAIYDANMGGAAIQLSGGTLNNRAMMTGANGGGTAVQMSAGVLYNSGTMYGGAGGSGQTGQSFGGANGGSGGLGVYLQGGGVITNKAAIQGGAGGNGVGAGSYGGAGGTAVEASGGALTNINTGVITGGAGGRGGSGGEGGAGGAGVYLSGGADLTNKGLIAGGAGVGGGAAGAGVIVAGAGTVDNYGTIVGGAYSVVLTSARGVLKMETGSALVGLAEGAGGTLEVTSGYETVINLGAAAAIYGSESLSFSGFGSYQVDAQSTWNMIGTDSLAAGNTLQDQGKVVSAGVLTVAGTISGSGYLTIAGGLATFGNGAGLSVANLSLREGLLTVNENLSYAGSFIMGQGAILEPGQNDTLSLTGPSHLHGLIDGAGTVKMSQGAISGLSIGGTAVLIVTGNVIETAAMTIGAGNGSTAGFVIAKGAVFTIQKAVYLLHSSSSSWIDVEGDFVNTTPGGATALQLSITDNGVMEASGGTLDFAGAASGNGLMTIDSGAILKFDSLVASSLTVNFNGRGGTLSLRSNAIFNATIAGFSAGDGIDLLTEAATSVTLNGSDQLVVMNGTKLVVTLQLSGNYNGQTFHVGSDGNGGSLVTVGGGGEVPAFAAAMASLGAPAESAAPPTWRDEAWRPTLLAPRPQLV